MCSYNKVNNTYACENGHTLNEELRSENGFKGFTVSDWFATHSTFESLIGGLDQEMPNGDFLSEEKVEELLEDGKIDSTVIDRKVANVLSELINKGVLDDPPTGDKDSICRTDEHVNLARHVSENGAVLVKNDDNILPLRRDLSIAVIGDIANDVVLVGGGGSGEVDKYYTVTPLLGIKLHSNGLVRYANSTEIPKAIEIAKNSDVVIFVSGAFSTEGADRENLNLHEQDDQLISKISDINPHIIVVVHNPAAILLPWIDSVKAAILAFYPGEQSGPSISSILFGDVNPSGRLPITIPRSEDQNSLNTKEQYPGVNKQVDYKEQLLVGYRWNNAVGANPLFPFGHGLSYSTFSYSNLRVNANEDIVIVKVDVLNEGPYDGKEVIQIYFTFPDYADEPPRILKGFEKVEIASGHTESVMIEIPRRELSIWDITLKQWQIINGKFIVDVGASVRDIRLSTKLVLGEDDPVDGNLKFLIE